MSNWQQLSWAETRSHDLMWLTANRREIRVVRRTSWKIRSFEALKFHMVVAWLLRKRYWPHSGMNFPITLQYIPPSYIIRKILGSQVSSHWAFCKSDSTCWFGREMLSVLVRNLFPICADSRKPAYDVYPLSVLMRLMGSGVSRFLPATRLDAPDKVTGLTEREKRAIQENWRLVYRDLKGNGVELFVR